ncbi:MAG: ABC transporter ATP-binding protein [Magnetococcales bacterium]|nr:ABC transporter ATP-binding protein [Magnetococcales bacterium]
MGGNFLRTAQNRVVVRALEDISLELRQGDHVGLIGHNGSGKSTLLRVLGGILHPTSGSAILEGQTSSLLNLSSILDPEMTGYENIEFARIVLGIPARERAALVREVEELSELGDFLSLPVRTYSSGMQVRLSFTLLMARQPEILLLDEVLMAGDARFSEQARQRVDQLRRRTGILVFASHVPDQLRRMCHRVIWLEHGRIRRQGETEAVLAEYAAANRSPA